MSKNAKKRATVTVPTAATIPATVVVGETVGTVNAEVSLAEVLGAAENLPPVVPSTTPEPVPAATEPAVKAEKVPKADTRPRGYVVSPGGTVVPVRVTHTTDGGRGYRVAECDPVTWETVKGTVAFRVPVRDYLPHGEGTTVATVCEVFTVRHNAVCDSLSTFPVPTVECVVWICSAATTGDDGSAYPLAGAGFYRLAPSANGWTIARETLAGFVPVTVPAGTFAGSPWTFTAENLSAWSAGTTPVETVRIIPDGAVGEIVRDILTRAGDTLSAVSHYAGEIPAGECLSHIASVLRANPPSI